VLEQHDGRAERVAKAPVGEADPLNGSCRRRVMRMPAASSVDESPASVVAPVPARFHLVVRRGASSWSPRAR
jgi:hypothetical protein